MKIYSIIFSFLFFIFSMNVNSQINSCKESQSSSDLKFPIQDQDGLGTCYANSTSILIQASLGLSNPPSYQHLALIYSVENGDNKNLVFEKDGKDNYAAEGGQVCDTFNAAKNYGFCDAHSFNLDVFDEEDGMQKQKKLIIGFGKLIDDLGRNVKTMDDKKWDALRYNLINQIYDKKKDCGHSKEDFFKRKVQEKLPIMVLQKISGSKEFRDEFKNRRNEPGIASMLDEYEQEAILWENIRDTKFNSVKTKDGGLAWTLKEEFSKLILPDLIAEWIKGTENLKPKSYFGETEVLIPEVTSPSSLLFSNDVKYLSDSSGRALVFEVAQEWERCLTNFDEKLLSNVHLENLINTNQCNAFINQNSTIDPLYRDASSIADDLISKVKGKKLQNYNNRADALIDIFSPQCRHESEANSKKLLSKNCETITPNKFGKDEKNIINGMSQYILNKLCEKKPIGISVCTQFMSKSDAFIDTDFCENQESDYDENNKHGNHALTIVGHRMNKDNSPEYLIQNSWGKTCGVKNPNAKGVVCELDNEGKTTGRVLIC